MYGAQLIHALRRRLAGLEFFGVGGERMREAGCDTVIDAKDLAVVGITEILSHLPKIYGHFHNLISESDRRRPDLAVVIDSPATIRGVPGSGTTLVPHTLCVAVTSPAAL